MNRNQRLTATLIIGLIAVALVLVVILALNRDEEVDGGEGAETTDEAPGQLFPEAGFDESVTRVRVVDNESGVAITALLDPETLTWSIDGAPEGSDTGLGVDGDRIMQAVFSLPTLTPSRVLTEIESLGTYGLEEAAYRIEFTTTAGRSYTLDIGAANPGGAAYYVRIPDSPDVYLIPVYNLDPVLGWLETPPFLQPTPDPNATPTAEESSG